MPLFDRLETESLAKTNWVLTYVHHEREYKPLSNDEVVERLKRGFRDPTEKDIKDEVARKQRTCEVALLRKNIVPLSDAFRRDLGIVGGRLSAFTSAYSDLPVGLVNYKEAVALVVTSVESDRVFNVQRSDAKSRAAEMVSLLLPSLRRLSERVSDPDVQYYGMAVLYGARDFSDPDSRAEAEFVCVVAPRDGIARFARGELTDNDLLAEAGVFLSDKDTHDVKRVTLSLK